MPYASAPACIGDTDDGTGLHHMVFEVVDNSIDERWPVTAAKSASPSIRMSRSTVRDNDAVFGGYPQGRRGFRGGSDHDRPSTPAASDDNTYKVSGIVGGRSRW